MDNSNVQWFANPLDGFTETLVGEAKDDFFAAVHLLIYPCYRRFQLYYKDIQSWLHVSKWQRHHPHILTRYRHGNAIFKEFHVNVTMGKSGDPMHMAASSVCS